MGWCYFIWSAMLIFDCQASVLTDVFRHKNIQNAIVFDCLPTDKKIENQRLLQENFIRLTYSDFTQTNFDTELKSGSKLGIVINAGCKNWTRVLESEPKAVVFKAKFIWIVLTEALSDVVNEIAKYPIEVDSDVILINDNHGFFDVFEIFNTGFETKGRLTVTEIGHWNTKLHTQFSNRRDLSGVVLKCTVVIIKNIVNETFELYLDRSKVSGVDSVHKLKYFTVLKYMRDMYNFSYDLQRTNSWGYFKNGSFDGMVGALQHHKTDLGGSPVFIRGDRAKFIDYAVQTWQTRPCFIMRHPKHPKGFYSIYTRPLTFEVWYSILAMIFLTATILGLMMKLKFLEEVSDDTSTSLAILSIWSAICQQGISINRRMTSIQIVIFMVLIFSLTLYQYYNATVVSSLLREAPKHIRTLEDLLKSDLKTGVEDVLYNKDYFKRTTDPVALALYHKKIATSNFYNFFNADSGMALVKKGGFAFHVDTSTAYKIMREKFTEREICDAHEVDLYPPQNTAAVLRKGSPYREHVAFAIRKMYETGLMQRLKLLWDEPKPRCVPTPDSSSLSVSLLEFSMPLILLVLGMILSLTIFSLELAMGFLERKKIVFSFTN